MAVFDQQKTSYTDTTPQIRAIGDIIQMIDPRDTPLIELIGGLNAGRDKFQISLNNTKVELLEDELDPLSTTANQGTTITTATLSLTVTDASIFQDGHVIKMDSEYSVVTAVSTANNTITLNSRAYGGTNATHATGVTIEIVGMARAEGDDADYGPVVDITAPFNYTSIFQKGLNVSGTQQEFSQYGIDDELSYQADKAIPHLLRLVERATFEGIRQAGSATTRRSMGGLGTFITDNTIGAGGTIVKADIDGLMEKCYADGGFPDALVMNHAVANDLRAILDTSSFVRMTQENTAFGMREIEFVRTQYGELKLVISRWCPVGTAYMLTTSKVGLITYRPFRRYAIAKAGDSWKEEVVGEFTMLVANDKAHGKITGITS